MMKRLVSAAVCAALVLSTATSAFALNVVTMFGPGDGFQQSFEALVKTYETKSGVTVTNNSTLASEAWRASVVTDFNTGNEPDVLFFFSTGDADSERLLEKVVPIDTIRAAYPAYAKDINISAINSAKAKDGKAYAVPFTGFWEGLFTNVDVFDKYRLAYPTTWDNFTKSFKTLNDNRITPISVGFTDEPHYLIEHMILSAAGAAEHAVNPGTDISKVPASWATGLNMIKTIADQGAFGRIQAAASKTDQVARADFCLPTAARVPKAAMYFGGSWVNGRIVDTGRGNNVQVFPVPVMPGGKGDGKEALAGFTSGWYISQKAWADAATQKQAVDFVDHMVTKEAVRSMLQPGAAPAANIAVSGGTRLTRSGTAMVGSASATMLPLGDRLPAAAWAEVWSNAINLANGSTTAQAVLQKAIPLNK